MQNAKLVTGNKDCNIWSVVVNAKTSPGSSFDNEQKSNDQDRSSSSFVVSSDCNPGASEWLLVSTIPNPQATPNPEASCPFHLQIKSRRMDDGDDNHTATSKEQILFDKDNVTLGDRTAEWIGTISREDLTTAVTASSDFIWTVSTNKTSTDFSGERILYLIQVFTPGERQSLRPNDLEMAISASSVTTNVGTRLLLDNDIVKVWEFGLLPEQTSPFHWHVRNYVFCNLVESWTQAVLDERGTLDAKSAFQTKGQITYANVWKEYPTLRIQHAAKNVGDETFVQFIVELK